MFVASQVFSYSVGGACGFVAGAFCPAITRKVKALFVKESSAVKVAASSEVASAASAVEKKL